MTDVTAASAQPDRAIDPFTAEILRNYLVATIREMVSTTVRTAYSTCFSEAEDFTCALFDSSGRMIAQAAGIPIHVGGLGIAMQGILARWDSFAPDDVIVHNDPFTGGSHQADGTVCRPIFVDAELVGFAVNRGHWTDVGGMAPGGWSGTARHVVQEALRIPFVKLYDAGKLNADVRDLLLANVRLPQQLWGDLQAQIASAVTAERRIVETARKYGLETLRASFQLAQEYSRRRFLRALEAVPDATVRAREIFMENDGFGGGPYEVEVAITKSASGLVVDYAGTDGQAQAPVNCSEGTARAGTYTPLIAIFDPEVPVNDGLLDLIEFRAPLGSLVRPVYPAPVFAATGDPVHRLSEVILSALRELVPDRVVASSYATGNNITGWAVEPETRAESLWYIFESGGVGARATKDGNSADFFVTANGKNESMEVWEQRYPVHFEAYRLVPDSAGPGTWRGGLGCARHLRLLQPTSLTANADRHVLAPPGFFGGSDGTVSAFLIERDGTPQTFSELFGTASPSKFSNIQADAGDILIVQQGGGAGYGDPHERIPEAVAADVAEGYVSRERAERDYGVALDGDGAVDRGRTSALRPASSGDALSTIGGRD